MLSRINNGEKISQGECSNVMVKAKITTASTSSDWMSHIEDAFLLLIHLSVAAIVLDRFGKCGGENEACDDPAPSIKQWRASL